MELTEDTLSSISQLETDSDDVVVYRIQEETVSVGSDDVEVFPVDDGYVFFTIDDWYHVGTTDNEWLLTSGDEPEKVRQKMDDMDERYGDANLDGYPIEFDVSYRSDGNVFRTLWEQELLEPSESVENQFLNIINSVTLTLRLYEDHTLEVVDVDTWPQNRDVTINI